MHKKTFSLFLVFSLMIIAGCGFHLRGSVNLPAGLQQLFIHSSDPYGPITLQLKQILDHSGVTVEDQPGPEIITLSLSNERYSQTTFSQSASSKTNQYTLYFSLDYELQNNKGETLYGPKTIHTQGNYTVNEDAILTASTQEDTLRSELQKQTVYQLISQLNSKDVANAVKTPTKNSK